MIETVYFVIANEQPDFSTSLIISLTNVSRLFVESQEADTKRLYFQL